MPVLLDNELHQDVRVDTRATPDSGAIVNRALLLSSEFGEAHKEFPILLYRHDDSNRFSAHAILGFSENENLFVDDDEWVSDYVPASIARGPFSLGYVPEEGTDNEVADIKVMIDEDDPRLGADGDAVFLEFGGESPYLKQITGVLRTIDMGMRADRVFYPLLLEMALLEQVNIRITVDSDQQYEFADYFTIDREKLSALTASELAKLNASGALGLVYFLASSISNFQDLIRRRNDRSTQEPR
jgi:hypothetical protein